MATCAACGVERQCIALGSFVDSHGLKHRFDLVHMASGDCEIDVMKFLLLRQAERYEFSFVQ